MATKLLLIHDVIFFAFKIIPRILSSQIRVSLAETTTPISFYFSTTCKGELPLKFHLPHVGPMR